MISTFRAVGIRNVRGRLETTWRACKRKVWLGQPERRGGEFTRLEVMKMLKITLELKNARSENIAKIINEFADRFKIWLHDGRFYASFNLKSLGKISELSDELERIKGIKFRYIKIQRVKRLWQI